MEWDDVWKIIRQYHDPNVPPHITWLPDTIRFAWAFNDLLTIPHGSGPIENAPFRRMSEFPSPSRALYAMSGIYTFIHAMANDPTFTTLPTTTWRIGPYTSHRQSIPAVYLDGRAELLAFPFDPALVGP